MRAAAVGLGLWTMATLAPGVQAQASARDSAVAFLREAESELRTVSAFRDDPALNLAFGLLQSASNRLDLEVAPLDPPDSVAPSRSTISRLAREGDVAGAWDAGLRADRLTRRAPAWRRFALEQIGRALDPLTALAFADSVGELPGAVSPMLSPRAVVDRADEILAWVSTSLPDQSIRHETRVAVLRRLALFAPEDAWRRTGDLSATDRARVGIAALSAERIPSGLADSVAHALEADLDEVASPALRFQLSVELGAGCGSRRVEACAPSESPMIRTWFVNDLARGEWDRALEWHADLAERVPADSLHRLEALGLEGAGRGCEQPSCDVTRFDDLFDAWMPGIGEAEARAPGPEGDDLRVWITALWATRDPKHAAGFARRIVQPDERLRAAGRLYREAWPVAPLAAIEHYLDLTPPDAAMGPDPYLLALRLGRVDLAEQVFARIGPAGRFSARLRWAEALYRGGRWAEARALADVAVAEWELAPDARIDLGDHQAMLLRRAGLVDAYLVKVRAAPDPVTRASGLTALIGGFVEAPRRGGAVR